MKDPPLLLETKYGGGFSISTCLTHSLWKLLSISMWSLYLPLHPRWFSIMRIFDCRKKSRQNCGLEGALAYGMYHCLEEGDGFWATAFCHHHTSELRIFYQTPPLVSKPQGTKETKCSIWETMSPCRREGIIAYSCTTCYGTFPALRN